MIDIKNLKNGELINFTGEVIVFRDIVLKKIINKEINLDLKNKFIFFCGPVIINKKVVACGPTTSKRMEYGIPYLFKKGIKGVIGKGELDKNIFKNNGVYFLSVGGAGTYTAKKIVSYEVLALKELGPEAVFKFSIKNLPLLTGIDIKGKSIFNV